MVCRAFFRTVNLNDTIETKYFRNKDTQVLDECDMLLATSCYFLFVLKVLGALS